MKKLCVLVLCVLAFVAAQAQHSINPFFAPDGTVRLETQELCAAADSIVTINHRAEDIVWRRDIYRVIDLRQKQNFQLYFPQESNDPVYKSLIRLMIDAVCKGLPIYRPDQNIIKPFFADTNLLPLSEIPDRFMLYEGVDRTNPNSFVINYDSATNAISFNEFKYDVFIRNQVKYMVYETVFFSRATSRMYRKIIAIAPMKSDYPDERDDIAKIQRQSILFWALYDDLRPYLAANYIIPTQNESKRVTFDEFFEKRLFSSYIIGEGNIYNRMILDYCKTPEEAQKEQARIEYELLTFEQDLWEY